MSLSPIEIAEKLSWYQWESPAHIKFLNQNLTDLIYSGNKKIIVNLPPRHGKSEFISKYLLFWYLTQNKQHHIIFSTYDQQFANFCGRKVRDLVKQHGSEFDINLRSDAAAADHFLLAEGGGMTAVGAGGSLTGRGANLLIIDDPIKNDAEANSKIIRNNLWDWFNTTAFTRLEPNGTVIIVMTKWHEDDLCGRIMKRQIKNKKEQHLWLKKPSAENQQYTISLERYSDNDWINIAIPAIADKSDFLGRKKGEALWPNRYPIKRLNAIKNQLGEYWFNALYQQKPGAALGNIFKRKTFKYFYEEDDFYLINNSNSSNSNNSEYLQNQTDNIRRIIKTDCSIFATIDLAATISETSDWTAIIIFTITPQKEILILDVIREKFEGAEHLPLIREIYARWKPRQIGIESVQYQISLIQMARREFIPVKELKPDRDKVTRALPMAAMLESGKIYFKENAPWLAIFEDELLNFPKSKNDDQVDAFGYISYILQPLTQNNSNFRIKLLNKQKRTTDGYVV